MSRCKVCRGGANIEVGSAAAIPNAGVLEGIQYNEWFVAFGQFFDHGLDFIQKGANGFVRIPIPEGDPLWVDPGSAGFIPGVSNNMFLPRANLANDPNTDFETVNNPQFPSTPGAPEFIQVLKDGITPEYDNNTGLSIDQSQTYGSDPSVNAFIREYDAFGTATGRLITGAADGLRQDGSPAADMAELEALDHNLGTWADLIANAQHLGIDLVGDGTPAQQVNPTDGSPMLRVDPTGDLLFDPDPTAEWNIATAWNAFNGEAGPFDEALQDASDPFARDANGDVIFTNHPFLSDVSRSIPLEQHFVSGDHRANENFGLTAVHNVFHEEHNVQAGALKNAIVAEAATILTLDAGGTGAADAAAFINRWMVADPDTTQLSGAGDNTFAYTDADGNAQDLTLDGVNIRSVGGALAWNGQAVFQAARVVTESEYNHIAIDQYVGTLQPALPEFVSYSADIDMGISLEFSQAVFRLGHSMLTETIQIRDPDTQVDTQVDLFDGFLNPDDYALYGPEAITLGLMNQFGNEVDEFVTPALQQALVGLPLDLAALNIARGRDVGLPTLNELRDQVFQGFASDISNTTNGSALAPYTSWGEFGANLRHDGTLTNMIAAYGRDESGIYGLQAARDAVADGTGSLADLRAAAQAIRDDAAAGDQAANDFIWGGYATPVDDPNTAVNEALGQLEQTSGDLGFWDVDLWIGGLAERPLFDAPLGTTFSFIMLDFGQRMQDGDRFYYLYRMPPGHHLGDQIIGEQFNEMISRTTGLEHLHGDAFGTPHGTFILNDDQSDFFHAFHAVNQITLSDGTTDVAGNGHFVVAGLGGDDRLILGNGDDTAYGDDGNDYIQGGQGNDKLFGGAGDDFIIDDENDDFIHGGEGNDTIFAGPGVLDTAHGGKGNDEVHGGDGIDEIFGEEGDDALFGEGDTDLMLGGEGNDYFDGGDSVDEMFGGQGNDWFRGGVGDDHMNGGLGNDLMEGGLGPAANDGDRYFGDTPPGLLVQEVFAGDPNAPITDFLTNMDIASYEDVGISILANLQTSNNNGTNSNLIDQYAFVEGLVGSRFDDDLTGASEGGLANNGWNNYLVGGAGEDRLTGLGGDDLIFGDMMVVDQNLQWRPDAPDGIIFQNFSNELRPDFGEFAIDPDGAQDFDRPWYGHFLGELDGTLPLDGNGVPTGGLAELRAEVVGIDTAVYRGLRDEYDFTANADGTITVDHARAVGGIDDGTDTLMDIEFLEFDDGDEDPTTTDTVAIGDLVNRPPVVGAQVNLGNNAAFNAMITITLLDLLGIASDPDNDPLDIQNLTASSGSLQNNNDGTWTFTPDANDTSDVTFSYEVTDGLAAVAQTAILDLLPPAGAILGTENDDVLTGTPNADIIDGLGGNDTINAHGDADLVFGGDGNDRLRGNAGNDTIYGGNDRDVITGSTGDDQLFGGAGNDWIHGGDGADTIDGGSGHDWASYNTSNAAVTIDLALGTASGGHAQGDVLSNIESLQGSAHGDHLTGSAQNNTLLGATGDDTLKGGAGIDWLRGGAGADDIDGGSGRDTASYNNSSSGVMVDIGSNSASGGDATGDTLTSIENLIGSSHADDLIGSSVANTLQGRAGQDNLEGGGGNDFLLGGADADTIDGGADNDWASYSSSAAGVIVDLDAGTASGGDAQGDTIIDIENLQGSSQADDLTGSDGVNVILGGGGNDNISGGLGTDVLFGGAGDDDISGGLGVDQLFGGAGSDTFVFGTAAAADGDVIRDFEPGDILDVSGIDADINDSGNQSFVLLGSAIFTEDNQIIFHFEGGNTVVEGDTNKDGDADFSFEIAGQHNLTNGDFFGTG